MGEGRGDGGQDGRHGDEAHREGQPRQREDEEAQVEAELRIGDPERLGVAPEQEGLPLRRRGEPGGQPGDERNDERRQSPDRLERLAVTVEGILLGRCLLYTSRCV